MFSFLIYAASAAKLHKGTSRFQIVIVANAFKHKLLKLYACIKGPRSKMHVKKPWAILLGLRRLRQMFNLAGHLSQGVHVTVQGQGPTHLRQDAYNLGQVGALHMF